MAHNASKKARERIREYAGPAVSAARLLPGSTLSSLLLEIPALGLGPLHARTTLALDDAQLQHAIVTAQAAIVAFEDADTERPIVVGLIQPAPELNTLQTLLVDRVRVPTPRSEAHVDGKRLVIEGRDEVVLKCGESSITLRKDGKVVVRGVYVETCALGVNRIKGASVKIN